LWHVTIALHPRLGSVSDAIRGWCAFCQGGRFDRLLLKCYKSTFCVALALRLQGASLVRFGVITDRRAAASSRWNVNNLFFGRAKQRLAERVCWNRVSRQAVALRNAFERHLNE